MKKINSIINFLIVGIIVISIISSCNPIDNSDDVNNLVQSSGHFDEPPHYEPTQVGNAEITTVTENGVDYQKTVKTYNYAQKFESKTQANFSKKKDLKSDNDIFLGAVIQGQYWRNDGDLISIGSFDRKNMTITISGIDISGTNSYDAYPSNAEMTDAINYLTSATDFTPNTNNYSYVKETAYTKQQVGLSFGLHPAWMENIGFDFGIENTFETNTVYVYFRQIYYTISAELPSQPADFFADNVDLDALNTKITNENPAGYISSIDYGRVIVVKMTSSNNKTEMEAAIGAVFNGLNVGVSAEYQNIIDNSNFEAQVYGGVSTSILTEIDDVINYINEGLTITNLQSAVPIDYHVHYLDGGSFNTGDEIEYTETDYEVTNASSVRIKKVVFKQLPPYDNGSSWDVGSAADVFLQFWKWNGTDWIQETNHKDPTYTNITEEEITNGEVFWEIDKLIIDFDQYYAVVSIDDDQTSGDDIMDWLYFSVNENILNSGSYPTSVTLSGNDLYPESVIEVVLFLEWGN